MKHADRYQRRAVASKQPPRAGSIRMGLGLGLTLLGAAAGLVAFFGSRPGERGPETPPASVPLAVPRAPAPSPAQDPAAGAIPVRVTFVDALTGAPMPEVRWKPAARLEPSDLSARWEAGWLRSGDAAPLPPPFDGIAVDTPEGYVSFPPALIASLPIPRARSAALTVPLDREAVVRLAPDLGEWVDRIAFRVTEAEVDGLRLVPELERAGDRLLGIPFRRGALLRLVLSSRGGTPGVWCGTGHPEGARLSDPELEWWGLMGEDPSTLVLVDPALPRGLHGLLPMEFGAEPWDEVSLVPPDDGLPPGSVVDLTVHGTVRLRLLDRAGAPASGVQVAVRSVRGRTDDDGAVTLERVPGGDHFLRVLDEGWAFPPTRVTVAGADVSEVVARELRGGEVEVRVEDSEGLPVPCALLSFRRNDHRSVWDLNEHGVRRLDAYVGADGRRVLAHLLPGVLHVRARLGTRAGQARVEVTDGGHQVVTITLPSRASR